MWIGIAHISGSFLCCESVNFLRLPHFIITLFHPLGIWLVIRKISVLCSEFNCA